jgi:hypothetical protein
MVKGRKKKGKSIKPAATKRVRKVVRRARRPAQTRKAKKPASRQKVNRMIRPAALLAAAPAAKQLQSGAGVPAQMPADVFAALNVVAGAHNVDPAAIAGIINTESVWDTKNVTGSYIGLTQVGPDFVQSLKMTQAQFLALSAADQTTDYGKWLDYYKFNAQMAKYNLVLTSLPLAEQAAVLQGMQFSPNGQAWKAALANNDTSVPTTKSKQAAFLGDTSIGDMTDYYAGFFKKYPPVYG